MTNKKERGRPRKDNPKNIMIRIRVSETQKKQIFDKADKLGISVTELILKGIDLV